ncbi:LysR family transcriptional regulator [Pseudorhodoplanes sinuspersici]|uniref:LysR family transcriptional regulator n=1 Tax=Pseudorhodoplanes sinuspersici TaxID=1235591 RepID=A0A1W6ZRJ6_9HYPH|nr:LysR family transcriptional regulator [Pseudorhodoplanes sinuspersici]ARP99877.1 LysR family transcriptional regulator [Pseudorhodoplanes sinuspersici]RKE70892.1 DNA-binding transcriptional LysR family regulator [Pseudorhodoplanes sinuspersici]
MLNETNLSRTDLNLLVLFQAVMNEGHVGRAAQKLNLTASAVSHGLGRLRLLLNDPLFLRTPKGVVPTERATQLAAPIADILARVSQVVSTAEPFDPAISRRTFTIGAPDAVMAVVLPPLLKALRFAAPHVDVRMRQLLPPHGSRTSEDAWSPALAELDARTIDIAIAPVKDIPARFVGQSLYEENFIVVSRTGHPYAKSPSLEKFCEMQHLLVSLTGDSRGFVDDLLVQRGAARRVVLTVPNFMLALAILAETDFIAAMPRRLAEIHAKQFGLTCTEAPMPLRSDPLRAVASKASLTDAGVAWLFGLLRNMLPARRPMRMQKRRTNA